MDGTSIFVVVGVTLIALMIADQNKRILEMLDFSRMEAALDALAASIDEVTVAIRNPQVDNNSQAAVDALATRLETISEGLTGLASEETAMDTADQIAEQPAEALPEDLPAPTASEGEMAPTGEGTDGNA